MKKSIGIFIFIALVIAAIISLPSSQTEIIETVTASTLRRSFPIEVQTIGELEAAQSISIATNIRSDQPKIIDLVADGANVKKGELLVKIDPTPYEKRVEELEASLKDSEAQIATNSQALAWEMDQADHATKAAAFEMEVSELELNKVLHGDGPLEIARLNSAMQKAKVKFEELNNFAEDLIELEQQGFLNPTEVRQTQKKLEEEKEAFENAKLQYESYIEHVHPMQIKKAETAIKRLLNQQEEAGRGSRYRIEKAESAVNQERQRYYSLSRQLQEAKYELSLTEIHAPSPGMVVLRDEFRSSQRRKPRVGDILVRNQPILDLPDLTQMNVKTKVRELDLYKIDIGKKATVMVDAYPDLSFEGTVSFIGILALPDALRPSDEKHFEVKVVLETTDPRLRPGMTSRVLIHAGTVKESLSVPIHAVFESGKQHYCFVKTATGYQKQLIQIGMNNEQWVEVKSGLNENDLVCLSLPPEEHIE